MCSAHAHPLLASLLGLVVACSHQKNTTGEAVAPASAPPRSVVTAEDIERMRGPSIEQVLMTRFPGVIVARTNDGGISVHIRGVGSFLSSNEPLYVIDEVPMQLARGASLRSINPYDIESIEVLKEPSETALYGVRGANGVVVIKTRRPGS